MTTQPPDNFFIGLHAAGIRQYKTLAEWHHYISAQKLLWGNRKVGLWAWTDIRVRGLIIWSATDTKGNEQ